MGLGGGRVLLLLLLMLGLFSGGGMGVGTFVGRGIVEGGFIPPGGGKGDVTGEGRFVGGPLLCKQNRIE